MIHGSLTEDHIIQSNLIEGIKDVNEVPKSLKAWEYLSLVDVLTSQNVLDVHALIMDKLLTKRLVGTYRPYNVEVGGRLCPHYSIVSELMDNWLHDMRLHFVLDPKTMHIFFEFIHPFADGNGRTGRLLMWWHEVKLERKPTLITYEERQNYYSWFEKAAI
jgi:Fic family protein